MAQAIKPPAAMAVGPEAPPDEVLTAGWDVVATVAPPVVPPAAPDAVPLGVLSVLGAEPAPVGAVPAPVGAEPAPAGAEHFIRSCQYETAPPGGHAASILVAMAMIFAELASLQLISWP